MRLLAESLATAGTPAMRFDYDGVGDSAGGEHDEMRVPAWLASLREAERVLREKTGVSRVVVVALRVGCALALEALPDMPHVTGLVMLAPLSGRTFVRELQALARLGSAADELEWTDAGAQVAGYWMSRDALDGLQHLGKRSWTAAGVSALLIPRDDLAADDSRTSALLDRYRLTPEIRNVAGYQCLMTDPHKSELSPGLARAVVEFCVAHSQPGSSEPPREAAAAAGEASATIAHGAATVEERVTRLGPGLVAVRTNPVGVKAARGLVVMVNAGAVHHIGVNRSHVLFARQLASRGTSALRLDLEGLGDSAVGHEPVAPRLYSTGSLQSLVTTLAELRRERPVVVIGLCAGAYSAYHAALQSHVDGLILINPQTFGFKEGDPIDVPSSRTVYKQAIDVRHHMHDVSAWKRLLRGQVNVARAVRVLAQQTWLLARTQGRRLLTRMGAIPASDVERGLRKLASSGTKVCLIFSETDPGLSYLDEVLTGRTHLLVSRGVVNLTTIDRADHTFTPRGTQDELLLAMTSWLSDAFGV
jgi:alpha-beta hydrolase superfamily lysophospholipase